MYTLEDLCLDIRLAEEATQAVLAWDISGISLETLRREDTWDAGLEEVKAALGEDPDGFGMLACQLRCALDARKDYQKLGIPHEIFAATMACFSRFVAEHKVSYGRYGFDRGFWSVRQIACKIFRIGELEYELFTHEGMKAVSIHIPSDAKLDLPLLRASWEQAKALIGATFPDFRDVPYICESWLLSPDLIALLPEDSRILAFQRNFRIEKAFPDESFREWVFKNRDIANTDLTEHTSLQRNLKAFVLAGNTFRNGEGVLAEEPFR